MCLVITQLGHGTQTTLAQRGQVHARRQGTQRLVGADVGSGFFAADVLLAGDQSQHETTLALSVHRLAHQTTGHLVLELILAGEVAQVWPAKADHIAQWLPLTDDDVRSVVARRGKQSQRNGIGTDDKHGPGSVHGIGQFL